MEEGIMTIELKLSMEEAQVLVELLGDVTGVGDRRDAADRVYGRLQELLIGAEGPVVEQ
jgi:hypothetical protein